MTEVHLPEVEHHFPGGRPTLPPSRLAYVRGPPASLGLQLHPRHQLDELIHTPVPLSMMAAPAAADSIDFRHLRDLVEVSDSLLSKHISTLEEAVMWGSRRVIRGNGHVPGCR